MNVPEIQALGITQDHFTGRWQARGYVEGIGWLEAWAESLVAAMEALQQLAAQRMEQREDGQADPDREEPRDMTSSDEQEMDPMDPSRADKWVYSEEDTPSLLPHLDRTRAAEAAGEARTPPHQPRSEPTQGGPPSPQLAITDPKAAVLQRLRAMQAEGLSLQAIANRLNNEGVPTLSGKGRWQKGTIGNLLAHEDHRNE
jgi:hypothetical protein